MRIGHGFDVHAFSSCKGPIVIGGIRIPFKRGVLAHSDGDVVLHALINAILGALALGDIGKFFPNTDLAYKNINSRILLREVWQRILDKGYMLNNADITIIAQEPKMVSHIPGMRKLIAEDLCSCLENINLKSVTTEKLGFLGRGEGVASEAVVLLKNKETINFESQICK